MSPILNNSHRRQFVATFLTSLFCFSSFSPVIASPPPKIEQDIAREKGLLDGIFKGGKICLIPGLCVNTRDETEKLLAKQIRDIAKKNAPITASGDNLFPVVGSLPGESFEPDLLDLRNAQPDEIIPPGDYVIPVRAYCLQKRASSPKAHRYVLGQYAGKKQKVLAAFNKAVTKTDIPTPDLQNLSWAIQSGVTYQEMPPEMQTLFNRLIPEHRGSLNQDFWQQIESVWNSGSKVLNLSSFRSFVGNKLGDVGTGLLTYLDVRERLISRGSDWRNLSDIFIINDGTQGAGNILNTPWNQLSENVYARFITEGSAGDTGFLLLRIKETPQQTKALSLLAIAGAALTVYELYDLISTLMALPEGNANIQPLAIAIDLVFIAAGGAVIGKVAKVVGKKIGKIITARKNRPGKDNGSQQNRPNQPSKFNQSYRNKQAARDAVKDNQELTPKQRKAGREFFDGANGSSSRDFRVEISDVKTRFEFFTPARNQGYGKLYVQEVDSSGNVIREFKDTLGPNGLVERKFIRGEP